MKPTTANLVWFTPLIDSSRCADTAYFELHPKELPTPDASWLPGSLFVKDAAFDFFAQCFAFANESFDYFAYQRYDATQIEALKVALDDYLKDIKYDTAHGQLFSRYASVVNRSAWDDVDPKALTASVYQCGQTIRAFVELHSRTSPCLWVLGL
jgi:hypothetical protein